MLLTSTPSDGLIDIGISLADTFSIGRSDPVVNWLGFPLNGYSSIGAHLGFSYFRVPGISPRKFYGGLKSPERRSYRWDGDKPSPKNYDGLEDYSNYSNPISTVLSPRNLLGKAPFGQKQVRHLSATGEVFPTHSEFYTYRTIESLYTDYPWVTVNEHSGVYSQRFIGQNLVNGIPTDYGSDYPLVYLGEQLHVTLGKLSGLQDRYTSGFGFVGLTSKFGPVPDVKVWGDFTAPPWLYAEAVDEVGENSIRFRNYVWITNHALRLAEVFVQYRLLPLDGVLVESGYGNQLFQLETTIQMTHKYHFQNTIPSISNGLVGWIEVYSNTHNSVTVSDPLHFPLTPVYTSHGGSLDKRFSNLITSSRKKNQGIRANFGLIRPACMWSYSDAISNMRATDVDYVEVLVEGKELFELLPSLVSITKAFLTRDIKDGADAGFRIGDLLANTTLLKRFGFDPTISNASDIISIAKKVGQVLKQLQSPATFHGKFVYQLDDPRIGKYTLVTRSTVRVNGASDDFIIKALNLDALGLLPSTSNLWDVVPWSWFIDGFINLSGRYSVIDSVFLGLVRGVNYCVHSFTLYDDLQGDLANLGLVSADAVATHYYREVSRFVPFIFHSEIDYGNTRTPDAAITAAILWNLSRGVARDFSRH